MVEQASQLAERVRHRAPWLSRESGSETWLTVVRAALQLGPVLVLGLLWLVLSLLSPVFFTQQNMTNLGVQAAIVAVLAIGQLVVIVTRGIDLSVGSTLALATVTGALAYDTALLSSGFGVIATMIAKNDRSTQATRRTVQNVKRSSRSASKAGSFGAEPNSHISGAARVVRTSTMHEHRHASAMSSRTRREARARAATNQATAVSRAPPKP